MKRSGADASSRAAAVGRDRASSTPTQQFCWKYSVADRGSAFSAVYLSSPISPLRTLAMMCVELLEQRRDPRRSRVSVITNFRRGKRSNTPREQHVHERALRVEAHLGDHDHRDRRVPAVVGRAGAAVQVDRDVEVLEHRPQRVVVRVVERLHPLHVGRDVRQQHAAAQAVLLDPLRVLDRVVDVVEEDLTDAGTSLRVARRRSRRASGCAPGCRRGGARSPRASAAARTARSSGRTAARCSGRSTSPTTPSASWSALRRSSSQLRTRRSVSRRSFHGFLYFPRHASKSSRNFGSRYSRYVSWFAPAWRVGRDDRVVVRGRRGHADLPGHPNAASFVPHRASGERRRRPDPTAPHPTVMVRCASCQPCSPFTRTSSY